MTASGQSTATESTPDVTVTEAFLDQTAVYVTDGDAVVLFNSEPDHTYVYVVLHPAGTTVQVTLCPNVILVEETEQVAVR